MKRFRPKDGSGEPPAPGRNGERDFHGEQRTNDTHASTTDPEARLFRKGKGKEAKLCFMGHLLMENRHGLIVDGRVSEASGTAERDEAQAMVAAIPGRHRITVGGDKNFDTAGFVAALQELNATPHVAQNTSNRRSAIDGRTTRHPGYAVSQRIRKRIEEGFGWIKEVALQRRARHRGKERVGWQFTLAAAAYNLIRLPKLLRRRDGDGHKASGSAVKTTRARGHHHTNCIARPAVDTPLRRNSALFPQPASLLYGFGATTGSVCDAARRLHQPRIFP